MGLKVKCWDHFNRPSTIQPLRWLRENKEYTVTEFALLVIKGEDTTKSNTGREMFRIKGIDAWQPASRFTYDKEKLKEFMIGAEEVII